jgi:hypothetical protein
MTGVTLRRSSSGLDRVTAAELVDYTLYWYAIIHFLVVTTFARDSANLTSLLIIVFFTFVLLRNYLVMHEIDTAERRDDTPLDFLSGNQRLASFLERLLRFAIMFTVIVTPKGAFDWANSAILWLVDHLTSLFLRLYPMNELPHLYGRASVVHDAVPYYCGVLFLLFIEFLLWDIVNVAFFAVRLGTGGVKIETDLVLGTVEDPHYRSILRYLNICRRQVRIQGPTVLILSGYLTAKYAQRLESGRIVRLYFASPKFMEQACGLLAAFLILATSLLEMQPLAVALATTAAFFYGVNAYQNELYVRRMYGHVLFPLNYLFGGRSPYT